MTRTPPTYQITEVPIDDLRPDPANSLRLSEQQIEALTRSIQKYGFVQPVLARREDKTVIGGHQRLVAARRLGYRYRAGGRTRGTSRKEKAGARPASPSGLAPW